MVNLPKIGVRTVVENYAPFRKQIDDANKQIQKAGDTAEQAGKKAGRSGEDWLKLGLKIAGATIALKAFSDFAVRGAQLEGVTKAFNNISASVGILAKKLLNDLRQASAGTISDFELMRLTNLALAGATGDFAKQFGESLPKLLEIARVQARATGQSVDYLYQSLVTGIKRSSPMLIDNTGITLKLGEANQKYADSLGKTVDQLTTTERQQAVLNATLEAGQTAIDAAGEQQLNFAEQVQIAGATIQNILGSLSLALQPLFNVIGGAVNGILGFIKGLVDGALPYIKAFADLIASGLKAVGDLFSGFIGEVNFGQIAHDFFTGAASLMGNFVNGLLWAANNLILPAVTGIANLIGDFLLSFSPPKKGPLHFIREGGENLIAEYVEGMLGGLDPVEEVAAQVNQALTQMVGPVTIATVTGRLQQLDKALLPFQNRLDIVKSTFDELSEPAQKALDAIDRQIDSLTQAVLQGDQAAAERIRQLDMQKAAIQGAVDSQQALVDRAQIQLALAKSQQSEERTLLEILKARLPAMKQAQAIQQKTQKTSGGAAAKPTTGGGGAPSPQAPSVGAPGLPPDFTAEPVDFFGGQDKVDQAKTELIDSFLAPMQDNLTEFQDKSAEAQKAFDKLGEGFGNVGKRLGQIGLDFQKNFGDPIRKAINDVGQWLTNPDKEYSLPWAIKNAVDWLTNPEHPGGLANAVSNLFAGVNPNGLGIGDWINTYIVVPISLGVMDAADWLTNPEHKGGLAYHLSNLFTGLTDIYNNVKTWINDNILNPIGVVINGLINWLINPDTEGGLANAIVNIFSGIEDMFTTVSNWVTENIFNPIGMVINNLINWLINPDTEGGLAYTFANILTWLGTAIGNVATWFNGLWQPIVDWVSGTGDAEGGGLPGIIRSIVGFFASLPQGIVGALRSLGVVLWKSIAVPIISMLNVVIDRVNDFISAAYDIIGGPLMQSIANLAGVDLGAAGIQQAIAQGKRPIGRLSTEMPGFLMPSVPSTGGGGGASAAATGGMFSGLVKVGERGPEYVGGSKLGVFPNSFVSAVDNLTQAIIAQPLGMGLGGGISNSTDNSLNIGSINGIDGAPDMMRRLAMLRAIR